MFLATTILHSLPIEFSEIHLDDRADSKFDGAKGQAVPAVYLGMIGVHSNLQGQGIGKIMMENAILRTAKIAQHAGLDALTLDALDALDEGLVTYYRDNFDFQTFKEGIGLEMFLPIRTILKGIPDLIP